jgi:two-component system, cell cycle response regulator
MSHLELVPLPPPTGGPSRRPWALFERLERRDLAGHAINVAGLAVSVCDELGLDPVLTSRVQRAALLHDVGKLSLPASVLDGTGPLSDAEWLLVREHPAIGADLVRAFPWLSDVATLVRHHHERWDGAGYPDGLAGEDIPVGARIIAACDAYDAMVSPRPYRAALGRAEALRRLRQAAGAQFDPEVVDALSGLMSDRALARI